MNALLAAPAALVAADADFNLWIADQFESTAVDFAEVALHDAVAHPAVRRLLVAVRNVFRCNDNQGGAMFALSEAVSEFDGLTLIDDEPAPASKPSSEPPPF